MRHYLGGSAEGAGRQTAADILAERRQVRLYAQHSLDSRRAVPRRLDLIENQQRTHLGRLLPQHVQEVPVSLDIPTGTQDRFDDDPGEFAAGFLDQFCRSGDVVEVRQHPVKRHVEGAGPAYELDHSAVIAVIECQ